MKLEYLMIIPALAIGWGLGSYRQSDVESPSPTAPEKRTTTSRNYQRSGVFDNAAPNVPTSSEQCRQALEDLLNQDDLHPMVRRTLQDRALRAWLEIDALEALSYAEKQVRFQASLGNDLFRVWVDLDPEGAKRAFAVASPALVESCFQTFCGDLGRKDPEGTLDFIASRQWVQKGAFDHEHAIAEIYSDWATKDPQAALARAGLDQKARIAALTGWAKIDPLAAWKTAWEAASKLEIETSNDELRALKKSFRNDGALVAIAPYILSSNPDLYKKISGNEMSDLFRNWLNADFEGARKLALSLPEDSSLRKSLNRHIADRIAISDPEGAISLFQESGGSETSSYHNSGLFKKAFISLNSRDPERARTLLSEIPEQHRTIALGGILTNEFAADPTSASLRCREFLNDPTTQKLVLPALERALSHGYGSGNHDLTQIVAAIPELRPKVTGYLLEGWARIAPEAAAAFLAEEAHHHAELGTSLYESETNQDPNSEYNPGLAGGIAELTFSRPGFTSSWVSTLPPGDFQNNVASSLATNWARFDRESAEAWVQSLPQGGMKEQAEEALVKPVNILSFEERRALMENR